MRRNFLIVAAAGLTVALGLAGCKAISVDAGSDSGSGSSSSSSSSGSSGSGSGSTVTASGPSGATSGQLTVLSEPNSGIGRIYSLITGAKHSVDLTMYELRDTTAENELAADAKRGVTVRVILDQHLEKSRNQATYTYLTSHGVHVVWAPKTRTYHQKTLTVDGTTSIIMTLNMVSEDYADTRDFAVIDTNHADIAAIETTFNTDFGGKGTGYTPPTGADLVWSPTNSQPVILAIIGAATKTLAVENEEMGSTTITNALIAAAKRGVSVTVTMTAESDWDSAFGKLVKAGAHVRTYKDSTKVLYIHAKAVVADAGRPDQQLFVGSENFSTASLRVNRELGLRTTVPAIIAAISGTLAADYGGATPFSS
ncbi:MAG TPA: phospholipase D-like domain-containing protein [Trebonia sp.]|nr:phospholipase D-like domain-containing protein [Trebonia sp.]